MAMTQICLFLTSGELDAAQSKFYVPPPPKPKPRRFRKKEVVVEEVRVYQRFFVCNLSKNTRFLNRNVSPKVGVVALWIL